MRYAYLTNKANAKRRGKGWELTFEEFEQFAYEYDYLGKKGITRKGYGIDRIDEDGPYKIGNIQLLKNPDNIRKYKVYDWQQRTATTMTVHSDNNPDNPF